MRHILHNNIDRTKPKVLGRLDVRASARDYAHKAHEMYRGQSDQYGSSGIADSVRHKLQQTTNDHGMPFDLPELRLRTKTQPLWRLADSTPQGVSAHVDIKRARSRGRVSVLETQHPDWDQWTMHDALVPDVSDKDTVLSLAAMAANAYVDLPFTGDWTNVSDPWSEQLGLGWMGDGLRGHIFANNDESVVVISIKGTSAAIFDSGGDTVARDKFNDNMLFSCCCARISYLWNTVCDCYTGNSYTCDEVCLEDQLWHKDRYYRGALDIYSNVTHMYPDAQVWVVGHSLGGAMAALLGRTYGLPTVAFEAPGEKLASSRLHLPSPPGIPIWNDHIWHFGHTADPVFMGVCNGPGSACWIGGYAMETSCHTGLQCVYDVVKDLGWHVSMVNHRIHVVIDDVISKYNDTPPCVLPDESCVDCYNWDFIVPGSCPSSSTTPTPTTTTTLSHITTTTTTTTSSSSPTCVRWNWFGRCVEWDDGH